METLYPQEMEASDFRDWMLSEGVVLRNLMPPMVESFIANGVIESPYATLSRSFPDPEAEFRRQQGEEWADRRLAFEDLFQRGRDFVYGVLAAGPLGARKYGLITVAIDHGTAAAPQMAVCAGNSLLLCTLASCLVNASALRIALGPFEFRDLVTLLRLFPAAIPSDKAQWPRLLFDSATADTAEPEFTEVIVQGPVDLKHAEFRIARSDYVALTTLAGEAWVAGAMPAQLFAERTQILRLEAALENLGKKLKQI